MRARIRLPPSIPHAAVLPARRGPGLRAGYPGPLPPASHPPRRGGASGPGGRGARATMVSPRTATAVLLLVLLASAAAVDAAGADAVRVGPPLSKLPLVARPSVIALDWAPLSSLGGDPRGGAQSSAPPSARARPSADAPQKRAQAANHPTTITNKRSRASRWTRPAAGGACTSASASPDPTSEGAASPHPARSRHACLHALIRPAPSLSFSLLSEAHNPLPLRRSQRHLPAAAGGADAAVPGAAGPQPFQIYLKIILFCIYFLAQGRRRGGAGKRLLELFFVVGRN